MNRPRSTAITTLRIGLVAGFLALAASSGPQAAPASPPVAFSHAVVTDPVRAGYEPDLALARDGRVYTSVPIGFSTTESWLWFSENGGNSYHLVPGTIPGAGKTATCIGGGDTDLAVDPGGTLYFSDLQGGPPGLSDARSTDGGATWTANCDGAFGNVAGVDRMWYGQRGSYSKGDLQLFQDVDDTGTSVALVETFSNDGVTFLPVNNPNAQADCGAGTALSDCVNGDEGIAGNQVVDPTTGDVYIAHNSADGAKVVVEHAKISVPTSPTSANPPTATGGWDHVVVYDGGHYAGATSPAPRSLNGLQFPVIAEDTAGNLYLTWTTLPLCDTSQTATCDAKFPEAGPPQIYYSTLRKGAGAWTPPHLVSTQGGTNEFPWIAVGDPGRVDIVYYHTDTVQEADAQGHMRMGSDNLNHASWNVVMSQSLNALEASVSFTHNTVTEYPNKYGNICTGGSGCASKDRSLGDFFEVQAGLDGRAVITYVDDSTGISDSVANTGDPQHPGHQNQGPSVVVQQVGGPSLYSGVGNISGPGSGPGSPVGSVRSPTDDAYYSGGGSTVKATPNLDVTYSAISQPDPQHLQVTMRVLGLPNLSVSPALGGAVGGLWMTRWTQWAPDPAQLINGHVWYVGMESVGGNPPTYFSGEQVCGVATTHCRYLAVPATRPATGSYTPDGTITITVPLSDVGNPAPGSHLYSVTGFTAAETAPNSNPSSLIYQLDATPPFRYDVLAVSGGGGQPRQRQLPNTSGQLPPGLLLLALLLPLSVVRLRLRTR